MTGHSADLNEIGKALALAQPKLPSIDLDGTGQIGQNRGYKYATLANVIKTTRAILGEHGLSVVQTGDHSEGGTVAITTTLLHESGQFISGTVTMPAGTTPQQYGSAMTYCRRYSLSALLNVASEDDLDGHEGNQPKQRTTAPKAPPAQNARQAAQEPQQAATVLKAPYLSQTPNTAHGGVWSWFAMRLQDLDLTQDDAKGLLAINKFHDDMGDVTFEQLLAWITKAKNERDKTLAGPRQHERS